MLCVKQPPLTYSIKYMYVGYWSKLPLSLSGSLGYSLDIETDIFDNGHWDLGNIVTTELGLNNTNL